MSSDWQNYRAGFPSSSVSFPGLTEAGILWAATEVEDTQTWDISESMRAEQTHPGTKGLKYRQFSHVPHSLQPIK